MTLDEEQVAALAARLAAARLAGATLADVPRLDLATGYAVQAAAAPALADGWGVQCGWKLGATSGGAMAFLGVTAPIIGRLYAARIARDSLTAPALEALEAEPEILLELGDDLSVARAFIGAEINRPALAEPFALGAGAIVADNAASFAIVRGAEIPVAALSRPATLGVALLFDGREVARGAADAVLSGPLAALDALRAALADDPRGLRPGDLIATGAMCRSVPLPPGRVVTVTQA